MSTEVRWRRGTDAQHAAFIGAMSEITHDTTNNNLRVHDGVTEGGHATLMAREKGAAGGIATLDENGLVPESQLGNVLVPDKSDYGSITAVETAEIKEDVQYLRTAGYYAPGDGGGALYKRVSTEPVHAGKIQSEDGAWWELAEQIVNPFMFGAKGDLVNDDADAINNCFAFFKIKNCGCFIPTPYKGYAISKSLQVYLTADWDDTWQGYRGKQLIIDKAANFKATAAMMQMLLIGQNIVVGSEYDGVVRDGLMQGGRFDCNDLANYGVRVPFFELIRLDNVAVWNAKIDYFMLGDALTPENSYEGMLTQCYTDRSRDNPAPAGSLGVRYTHASDHHVNDCVFKGVKRAGIGGNGTWHMKIIATHVWNNSGHGAVDYGFELMGHNQLIGCQVDENWTYAGYRFQDKANFLHGCNITKENSAVGGHFVDLTLNASVTAIGCKIVASTGHELAGEVTGDGWRNYTSIGNDIAANNNWSNSGLIHSGSAIRTGVFTVSTLPSSPEQGARAFVTDAASTSFGADLIGGGVNWVPVYFNGGGWKVG